MVSSFCVYQFLRARQVDYPYYWTSTTHASLSGSGGAAVYVAFGRALGYMNGAWVDVHGAGAQRSDPKSGNPSDYSNGRGPQGDAVRIYNYARLVRGGASYAIEPTLSESPQPSPSVTSSSSQSMFFSSSISTLIVVIVIIIVLLILFLAYKKQKSKTKNTPNAAAT